MSQDDVLSTRRAWSRLPARWVSGPRTARCASTTAPTIAGSGGWSVGGGDSKSGSSCVRRSPTCSVRA